MHDIERELIKVTGYKSRQKFSDRQDYLKSILNAVSKLTDDDFDLLSDEAASWANEAVEQHNSKKGEIPDFDEVEPADEDEADDGDDSDADDAEADESDEDDADEDEADDADGDEAADDSDAGAGDAVLEGVGDDGEDSDEDPDEDDEPVKPAKKGKVPPKPKRAPPAKKPKKAAEPDNAEGDEDDEPEEKPVKKPSQVKRPRGGHEDEDVILDKWGAMDNSKNSQALAMFEKGATTKEVKDAIGGTYYNVLKKCVERGHKLVKEGAVIKLTHKDEIGKKSGKAAEPTPAAKKAAAKPAAKKGKK